VKREEGIPFSLKDIDLQVPRGESRAPPGGRGHADKVQGLWYVLSGGWARGRRLCCRE